MRKLIAIVSILFVLIIFSILLSQCLPNKPLKQNEKQKYLIYCIGDYLVNTPIVNESGIQLIFHVRRNGLVVKKATIEIPIYSAFATGPGEHNIKEGDKFITFLIDKEFTIRSNIIVCAKDKIGEEYK